MANKLRHILPEKQPWLVY